MDKIHNSDLVSIFVRPKFRLLESWNDWIEYIDYDFWILNSVMERLKVLNDWKAILYSLQGDFLVFEVEVMTQVYSW